MSVRESEIEMHKYKLNKLHINAPWFEIDFM